MLYASAHDAGVLNGPLDRLFQETFKVAKRVHGNGHWRNLGQHGGCGIAPGRAGFGSDLADTHASLVGAGEMIELVAAHFVAGTPTVVVANRTLERGDALAPPCGVRRLHCSNCPSDCTNSTLPSGAASTLPLIGKGMIECALKQRRHPMFAWSIWPCRAISRPR